MQSPLRLAAVLSVCTAAWPAGPVFEVTLGGGVRPKPASGRLILVVSKATSGDPIDQVAWGKDTQQVFGMDVDDWSPGTSRRMDQMVTGYPLRGLHDLPAGQYRAQALLHVYETFRRADGHVLKLPMDDGEGQRWSRSPGNIRSEPLAVRIGADSIVRIELTHVIPPIPEPRDTPWIRHVRIPSQLLTKFWGRPMHLGAIVLVPPGFDRDTAARYPVAFHQGHFPSGFRFWRESPPPPELSGEEKRSADMGYRFYQEWTSGRLPKMLLVLTKHPTPYYDDSYGVNTANNGPYGDALTQELYPHIEKTFRGVGEPWARVLFGGSTGGWMTLAQQIFYPDYFGGAWGFCPDPVDFHAFQTIDVYADSNAYYDAGPFARMPKLLGRTRDDRVLSTFESYSRLEAALGSKGRSGGQLDAFHSVFGPVGKDGYPAPLWNPETGAIDPAVARYWRERFDLTAILQRDWERLGPKLVGKLHVTMGTKDTYFLDAAARRMEAFLESTKLPGKGPYYGGSFEYGPDQPHCWVGNVRPGMTREMHYLPLFEEHMRRMSKGN